MVPWVNTFFITQCGELKMIPKSIKAKERQIRLYFQQAKRLIYSMNMQLTNLQQWCQVIIPTWSRVSKEGLQHHVESTPIRAVALLRERSTKSFISVWTLCSRRTAGPSVHHYHLLFMCVTFKPVPNLYCWICFSEYRNTSHKTSKSESCNSPPLDLR